jgi:hypothetical protein
MSWTEVAKPLRSSANLRCADGEHALTTPRLNCDLKAASKSIQRTLTSAIFAVRLDHASGLILALNPTRGERQQGANR